MREKFFLYERVGVREYWVVHPDEKMIMVYALPAISPVRGSADSEALRGAFSSAS
jgi:Uma2 family endonuclease